MTARYRFGQFTFDVASGELRRTDTTASAERLPPQPARLLGLLAERGGGLVSRDEIRDALWPDTQVDFDTSLHFCVRQIRTALGDSASSPTYIETLPRRGYRLIPDVERLGLGTPPEQPSPAQVEPRQHRWLVGLVLLAATIVIALTYGFGGRQQPEQPGVRIAIMPFKPPSDLSAFANWQPVAEWILEELDARGGNAVGLVGPTTTEGYGGEATELRRLAADFELDFIINGRFLEDNGDPRMLAELIRVEDGVHVWVRAYRDLSQGRAIGQEIGANVARELGL